jgi:hypothetical protein
MKRIKSIVFDKHERPKRATIITPLGTIKVEWRYIAGQPNWTSTGDLAARLLAVPVIEKIQRLFF